MHIEVNYLAVLAAAVAGFLIGLIWYSPFILGKLWMNLSGITEEAMKGRNPTTPLAVSFIADLVLAYVLSYFIQYAGINTVVLGMTAGFWTWLGFLATVQLTDAMFTGKPIGFYLINTSYRLIALLAMGAILGYWV